MRTLRPAVRRLSVAVLLVLAVVLAVRGLRSEWPQVRAGAADLSVPYVAGAAVCAVLSLGASLLAWRAMLAALGCAVAVRPAARIFFLGQLGKYIPGSVWPVVAQMELGAAAGLPRPVVGTAGVLVLGVAVPGALVVGLLAAPALLSGGGAVYALVYLALPLALLVLWPRVLNPLLERALRLFRRPPLPVRLTGRDVGRVAAWTTAANLLLGLQAWLLAVDLGARGARALPLAVGAFSLALVAGLLALPVPAGAGVREAVLVASLSPVLRLPQALVVALVSRVLLSATDLAAAAAGTIRYKSVTNDLAITGDRGAGPSSQ